MRNLLYHHSFERILTSGEKKDEEGNMSTHDSHIVVTNNEHVHRYEVRLDNHLAVLTYERQGDTIIFIHTDVPPALEGHGIGHTLAHFALEEARSHNLEVIPECPFVAAYIRHHPEYLSLLPASEQARLSNQENV